MKAVVIERPGVAAVRELPIPEPGQNEVLVRVAACGICGTDHHIFRGEYMSPYPIVAGHEFAGEIAALGPNVRGWQIGDRVAVDPNVFCGDCYFCKSNRANHCQNFSALGVTVNGAFAEYVRAPARNLYRLPADLPFEEAALIEPVSCVVYALERTQIAPGSSVVIFGAGPMGQLLAQGCRRSGAATVTVVDLDEARLRLASELGAAQVVRADGQLEGALRGIAPLGFDVVVDATGLPRVVEGLFRFAKPTATILFFGVCPRDERVAISPYEIFQNDWRILGSFALRYTFHPALDFVASGAIQVRPVITNVVSLDELPALLSDTPQPGRLKVVVRP